MVKAYDKKAFYIVVGKHWKHWKALYPSKTLTTFSRKIFCTAIYQPINTTLLYTTTMYCTVACILKRVNKLNNRVARTYPVCVADHEVRSDRMYTFVSGARYAGVHVAGMISIMIPSGWVPWIRIWAAKIRRFFGCCNRVLKS